VQGVVLAALCFNEAGEARVPVTGIAGIAKALCERSDRPKLPVRHRQHGGQGLH
jgi:hypothetical protein